MSSLMNIFRSDMTLNRAFLLLNVNRKVFYIQIFCIYGHENEMYNEGVSLKEVECL